MRGYLFLNGELLGNKKFYQNYISKNPGDIYAADGGAHLVYFLHLNPIEIWGDMDSFQQNIDFNKNVIIKKFPKDKDYTDGELLLTYMSKKYDEIIIIGGLGGRKDHELTNINLLFRYDNVVFLTEEEKLFKIDNNKILENIKDLTVSFIPFSDVVTNLTLTGFKYNLTNYNLKRYESICMSNIAIEDSCKISFDSGKLIAVINN